MEHQTDLSKVEAANALLQSIKTAQNGRLKGVVNDMNDQVCASVFSIHVHGASPAKRAIC